MGISNLAVPLLMVAFVGLGLWRKVGVYDCFIEGAKEGIQSTVNILAPLVGLMVAIAMVRASGLLEILAKLLAPVLSFLRLPPEVLPLALLRPISGSASTAIILDLFQSVGPDSPAGKIASVMAGSTETTFYTIAVYFGALGIRDTRHTLYGALFADITGILLAIFVTNFLLL